MGCIGLFGVRLVKAGLGISWVLCGWVELSWYGLGLCWMRLGMVGLGLHEVGLLFVLGWIGLN